MAILLMVAAATSQGTQVRADIFAPTDQWSVVTYSGAGQHDYFDDQQTGNGDSDLVGDAVHAAFYMQFDGLGTSDLTDGIWSIRVRLGSDRPVRTTFDNNLFIGMDADGDAAIDLFVGVFNQGNNSSLSIWDPGDGDNISPSTTSIVSPPAFSIAQTASNYDFTAVSFENDPTATSLDIDNDGDNDYFLSFELDFATVVEQMNLISGIEINEASSLNFILATANSDNSLNQDLNGADGGIGSSSTWGDLGVLADPKTFRQMTPVPEPHAGCVLMILGMGCLTRRKR